MTCDHCGGDGFLHIHGNLTEDGYTPTAYRSPCHLCAIGRAYGAEHDEDPDLQGR